MTDKPESGLSLKDDIASIQSDPTFHDVTIVCSDGVEIGACRAILASRSPFFKAMLYGNMQEATSNRIILRNIKSTALHTVLQFIHTENIDSTSISAAIDVCHAANFLLLPKLIKLVLEQVQDIDNLEVATSFLNQITVSIPWGENTKDLYDFVLKPFCTNSLAIDDLNGLSEDALELLLKNSREMTEFNTPEYNLLLCIVEWAWTRNKNALSAAERRTVFDAINLMPAEPSTKIELRHDQSHTSLLKFMELVDLSLICPHRLKSLTEAIDVLTETWPQYLAFSYHACRIKCSAGHPSEYRGRPKTRLQWDQSKLANGLVLSEEGTVVGSPEVLPREMASVRASTPCKAGDDGLYEWDIVIESIASCNSHDVVILGLVSESFHKFNSWIITEWGFRGHKDPATFERGSTLNGNYGRKIQQGDIITFHLNMNKRTCSISINGKNYGPAWINLPSTNLYPAATLGRNAKFRIRPHVRL